MKKFGPKNWSQLTLYGQDFTFGKAKLTYIEGWWVKTTLTCQEKPIFLQKCFALILGEIEQNTSILKFEEYSWVYVIWPCSYVWGYKTNICRGSPSEKENPIFFKSVLHWFWAKSNEKQLFLDLKDFETNFCFKIKVWILIFWTVRNVCDPKTNLCTRL